MIVSQASSQPLTAIDLLIAPVPTLQPEMTIAAAHALLADYPYSIGFVTNLREYLVGSISCHDLRATLHYGLGTALVQDFMGLDSVAITPETSVTEAAAVLASSYHDCLPVVADDRFLGIIPRCSIPQLGTPQPTAHQKTLFEIGKTLLISLQQHLPPDLWQLLNQASSIAHHQGWHLYLIGGVVRDLLLHQAGTPFLPQDLDLVVDAEPRMQVNRAVYIAEALHRFHPEAQLQSHRKFQTAGLVWDSHPTVGSLCVDIATARTEYYPYAAANPHVNPCTIHQDLHRRDFTINALALKLTAHLAALDNDTLGGTSGGEPQDDRTEVSTNDLTNDLLLLDLFGGYGDLQARLVRVLHASSFIEDPTRIYRAVRFATKLGFQLESRTAQYLRYTLAQVPSLFCQVFAGLPDRSQRTPALEVRLRNELKSILAAPYWRTALKLLARLDALTCLHPSLKLTQSLWFQLRLVDRYYRIAASWKLFHNIDTPDYTSNQTGKTIDQYRTTLLLETLIASLADPHRGTVARNLQLPQESIDRLDQLAAIAALLNTELAACDRPSQIVQCLRPYAIETLVLVGVRSSRPLRRLIWRYLSHWRHTKPPLDGSDLQAMGYQPGKQFRQILAELTIATLDGVITATSLPEQRHQAEQFLKAHYPIYPT